MTRLQKLILDALDQLGSMTEHELRTACLIEPRQRGGFRTSLNKLCQYGFIDPDNVYQICLTPEGVAAIEADNIAHEDAQ